MKGLIFPALIIGILIWAYVHTHDPEVMKEREVIDTKRELCWKIRRKVYGDCLEKPAAQNSACESLAYLRDSECRVEQGIR